MNTTSVSVISSPTAFLSLEAEWRDLFGECPSASPPLRWEWVTSWWEAFHDSEGRAPGELMILALRDEGQLVAVLPLIRKPQSPNEVVFLGTAIPQGEAIYPEYLTMLCRPGREEQALSMFRRTLFSVACSPWDELYLGILSPGTALAMIGAGTDEKGAAIVREIPHSAPRAELSDGMETYFRRLSSSSRQFVKRTLRQRSRADVEWEIARSETEALQFLEDLMRLHDKRWHDVGQPGAFASQRVRAFHRCIIHRLIQADDVVLGRLTVAQTVRAVLYGFVVNRKFDFYQSGVDILSDDIKSPGILAHLLLMDSLQQRGVETYDFLAGPSDYKLRLATADVKLTEVTVLRPTLRVGVREAGKLFNRVLRRIGRTSSVESLTNTAQS